MDDGEHFQTYRVHLVRGRYGLLRSRLWKKWVRHGEPTYYDGEEVRKSVGRLFWPVDYWEAVANARFEIWGQAPGKDTWQPLSRALRSEQRLAGAIAAALAEQSGLSPSREADPGLELGQPPDPVQRAFESLQDVMQRCTPEPGRAEGAYHLLVHKHMRRDDACRAMQKIAKWKDVKQEEMKRLRGDGERRLRKPGEWCRFCSLASPNQIPSL